MRAQADLQHLTSPRCFLTVIAWHERRRALQAWIPASGLRSGGVPDPDIGLALDAVDKTYAPGIRGRKQRGGGSVQTELGSFRSFERLLRERFVGTSGRLSHYVRAVVRSRCEGTHRRMRAVFTSGVQPPSSSLRLGGSASPRGARTARAAGVRSLHRRPP